MKFTWKIPLLFAVCLMAFYLGKYQGSDQKTSSHDEVVSATTNQQVASAEKRGSTESAVAGKSQDTQDQAAASALVSKPGEKSVTQKELEMLFNSRGRDLFVSLFEDKLLKRCGDVCLQQIENRFKRPYRDFNLGARNFKDYEVRARLGLLKAMGESYSLNTKSDRTNRLVHLYEGLVFDSKQVFSIQRQALFNLREHLRHRVPSEKRALMARLPASLIVMGSMNERELIEEVVNAAK